MNPMLRGIQIIEDKNMVDKKQNRKHRKKRINKKWAKRYGFTFIPKSAIYRMGKTLIMHPSVAEVMRQKVSY